MLRTRNDPLTDSTTGGTSITLLTAIKYLTCDIQLALNRTDTRKYDNYFPVVHRCGPIYLWPINSRMRGL
jgi:hypothetical protein